MTDTFTFASEFHAERHAANGPDPITPSAEAALLDAKAYTDDEIAALNLGSAATHAATDFDAAGAAVAMAVVFGN